MRRLRIELVLPLLGVEALDVPGDVPGVGPLSPELLARREVPRPYLGQHVERGGAVHVHRSVVLPLGRPVGARDPGQGVVTSLILLS